MTHVRIRSEIALAALVGCDPLLPDADLIRLARSHRSVVSWIWWRLAHDGGAAAHPALHRMARQLAAREIVAAARLRAALDALGSSGIPTVLLKGAGLSYAHYPEPWVRPRLDDDVLVRAADFDRATAVLEELGYGARAQNPGPAVLGQAHFTRSVDTGGTHHIDLHWRPLVPAAFGAVPGADALLEQARPLPALGRHARVPAPAHLLLLGCAHRIAHHGDADDPQWTVDTHLLASGFGAADWQGFAAAARRSGVARVCAGELARARLRLGTVVPQEILAGLDEAGEEPAAQHQEARGQLARWFLEMRQHPSGAWQVFRARAFPPAGYMRVRYGVPAPLVPAAYVWRAVRGGSQWIADALARRQQGGTRDAGA